MEKWIPTRQCIGCGARREKTELLRVIRTPEGAIEIDRGGRGNGRGAYLCRTGSCLERAQKKRALARALKCEIPPETAEQLAREIEG